MGLTRSHRSYVITSYSQASPRWGESAAGLRRPAMKKAHRRKGYVIVAAAVGGDQSRVEAAWGTRSSGTRGTEGMDATRDRQLTCLNRLL